MANHNVQRTDSGAGNGGYSALYYAAMLYINLPILKSLLLATPAYPSLALIPELECIEDLDTSLGHIHIWIAEVLYRAKLKVKHCNMKDGGGPEPLAVGDVMSFNCGVRSRGVGQLKARSSGVGEIYVNSRVLRYSMLVSSPWITGDHARVYMGRGSLTLCGIFSIIRVDIESNVLIGMPILLAEPSTTLCRAVFPDSSHLMCFSN